jgi:hypothetical protein
MGFQRDDDALPGCDGRVRCKDAGSARSPQATGATEDVAACRPARSGRPFFIALEAHLWRTYHPAVVLAGGNVFIEVVIFLSSTVPVIGMICFAWWFLRAGNRYDERERAAGRRR